MNSSLHLSGKLPRLRDDVKVARGMRGSQTVYELSTGDGQRRTFSERVFDVIRELRNYEELTHWLNSVQRKYPDVTLTQLERLVETLLRYGFAIPEEGGGKKERTMVTKNPLMAGPPDIEPDTPYNPDRTDPDNSFTGPKTFTADIAHLSSPPNLGPKAVPEAQFEKRGPGSVYVITAHRPEGVELTERQVWIFRMMDGTRTIKDIIAAGGADSRLTEAEIRQLVRGLDEYGLMLDTAGLLQLHREPAPPVVAPVELTPFEDLDAEAAAAAAAFEDAPRTVLTALEEAGVPVSQEDLKDIVVYDGQVPLGANAAQAAAASGQVAVAPGPTAAAPHEPSFDITTDFAPQESVTGEEGPPTGPAEALVVEEEDDDEVSTEGASEAETSGVRDVRGAGDARVRRWTRRIVRLAIPLGLIAGVLMGTRFVPTTLNLTYECTVQPLDRDVIRAPMDGVLSEVVVVEGQQVKAGDVLARFSDGGLKLKVIQSRSALEKAKAELKLLQEGSRAEEIQSARAAAGGFARELRLAKDRARRVRKLVKQGVAPRDDLDNANSAVAALQGQVAKAWAEVKLLQAGSRPEVQKQKEAEIRSLEAALEVDEGALKGTELRARIDGKLITPRPKELVNSRVSVGDTVFEVLRPDKMRVDIYVAERDFDVLKPGLPVRLKVAAYPTASFDGEIRRIAQGIEQRDVEFVVRAEGVVDNKLGRLVPNMTGFAEINAGDTTLFDVLTRRVVRWFRVRFLL